MRDLTFFEEPIRKLSPAGDEFELFHGFEDEFDEDFYSNETDRRYDCHCNMCQEKEDPFSFRKELEHDLLDESLDFTNENMGELKNPINCDGNKTTSSCFTLHQVKCNKTEDWGADECLLKVYVDGV